MCSCIGCPLDAQEEVALKPQLSEAQLFGDSRAGCTLLNPGVVTTKGIHSGEFSVAGNSLTLIIWRCKKKKQVILPFYVMVMT